MFPIFAREGRSKTRYKVGYINLEGKIVIDPVFDEGTLFYEGLASVKVKGRWGVINATGNFVIEPKLWYSCEFRDGLAPNTTKNGIFGFIDRTGRFVIPPKYRVVHPFREGLALVSVGESGRYRYGFIDKTGEEVIPLGFHGAKDFSEGFAAVKLVGRWGYVRQSGLYAIAPRFDGTGEAKRWVDIRAGRFVNGLAPVWVGQDQYRFIDSAGSFAFDGEFDEADSFSESRAAVKRGDRYGYIDTKGSIAIECRYTLVRDFSDGLAKVEEENSRIGFSPPSGFIDRDGRMVIAPKFNSVERFRDGLSLVTTKDTIGYINKSGVLVWEGPFVDYGVLF